MAASREQKEVVEWLKSYTNLHVVSRDGSITYSNAISEAHPDAIQVVADTPEIKAAKRRLNQSNENRKLTLEEKYQKILFLQAAGDKSQTQICNMLNMDVRSYKKIISSIDIERKKMFTTIAATNHNERVENKIKLINEITKYLDANFNPISAAYGKKKVSILTPYYNEIDALLSNVENLLLTYTSSSDIFNISGDDRMCCDRMGR